MALPSITLPAGFPTWVANGYASEETPTHGQAAMSTGAPRSRKRFTQAERMETVSVRLTQAQMAAWHTWHEDTLLAGRLPFSAQFYAYGGGLVWFDTLLLSYTSTPQPGGVTLLQCQVVLRGDPSTTGPGPEMTTAITYPSTLPRPQSFGTFTPAPRLRRADLPGPTTQAPLERDFRGTDEITFLFTQEQAGIFDAWWRTTLDRGGKLFAATDRPLPAGWTGTSVRRFTAPPKWQRMGRHWQVQVPTLVLGNHIAPQG